MYSPSIACLREIFISEIIPHNNNNNNNDNTKVVIDSLSFVSYKLPFKVAVIAPCRVMQMKVYAFLPGDFYA